MKQIKVRLPEFEGHAVVIPVHVSWFAHLTRDQILQNVLCDMDGQPRPHEDQNYIEIVIER